MNPTLAANENPEPASIVEVWRGSTVESRHRGYIVAVDSRGRTIAHLGFPEAVTFLRSSGKPFQAIPLVSSGAADRFGFSTDEIAIACGSHSGQPIHTETVQRMLGKIGLDYGALKCGIHEPFDAAVTRQLRKGGIKPSVLQNNCSGKHAGMLALAVHLNASPQDYDQPDSPVQLAIAETVAMFSGVRGEDIALGIDGCGVPVFGISVRAMALMYARLVSPPDDWNVATLAACSRIVSAMTRHPEMVGGTSERLDTELMRAAKGALISKVGAEGVYTVGVLPCEQWSHGLGLAIKIEDGEDRRARPTVVIEALRQLKALSNEALEAVQPYSRFDVRNNRGERVGEIRPSFQLIMCQDIAVQENGIQP